MANHFLVFRLVFLYDKKYNDGTHILRNGTLLGLLESLKSIFRPHREDKPPLTPQPQPRPKLEKFGPWIMVYLHPECGYRAKRIHKVCPNCGVFTDETNTEAKAARRVKIYEDVVFGRATGRWQHQYFMTDFRWEYKEDQTDGAD